MTTVSDIRRSTAAEQSVARIARITVRYLRWRWCLYNAFTRGPGIMFEQYLSNQWRHHASRLHGVRYFCFRSGLRVDEQVQLAEAAIAKLLAELGVENLEVKCKCDPELPCTPIFATALYLTPRSIHPLG
jgi:hypothetical protein